MNDDFLTERAAAGDSAALEDLLFRHRQGILNLAYRMSGDAQDAQEICQEAAIKIIRYIGGFKKGASFRSWVYSITLNSARDFLRRKNRHLQNIRQMTAEDIPDRTRNPERRLDRSEMRDRLQRCLDRLTPSEKTVFLLRDGEGLSVKEAARVAGRSSAVIRTHLSRARKKLQRELEKMESEEGFSR